MSKILRTFEVWCVTENKYVSTTGENTPTQCPNDVGHTITQEKTIWKSAKKIKFIINLSPIIYSTKSTSYIKLATYRYTGANNLYQIKLDCFKDTGITSYSIRVQNLTTSTTVAEVTGLTNTTAALNDLGTLSNLSTTSALLEFQVKASNSSGNASIYFDQIYLYFYEQ